MDWGSVQLPDAVPWLDHAGLECTLGAELAFARGDQVINQAVKHEGMDSLSAAQDKGVSSKALDLGHLDPWLGDELPS